eukprot:COSAG02_NODE_1244_length_13677_cov_50.752246_5_plen_169_part_00
MLTVSSSAAKDEPDDTVIEVGGSRKSETTAHEETRVNNTTMGPDEQVCPSGWVETDEVHGRDDQCDIDFESDVVEYLVEYTGITEPVCQELSTEEGEEYSINLCSSFDLGVAFENCFIGEYSQHGHAGGTISPEMHTATVNSMRGVTPTCTLPIMAELLDDEAQIVFV